MKGLQFVLGRPIFAVKKIKRFLYIACAASKDGLTKPIISSKPRATSSRFGACASVWVDNVAFAFVYFCVCQACLKGATFAPAFRSSK